MEFTGVWTDGDCVSYGGASGAIPDDLELIWGMRAEARVGFLYITEVDTWAASHFVAPVYK